MKDFSNLQYKEIPDGELVEGDVFVCQTVDINNPFNEWNYGMGVKTEHGANVLGLFQDKGVACMCARAI